MQQVPSTSTLQYQKLTAQILQTQAGSTTDTNMLSDTALKLQTVQQDFTQRDMSSKASLLKQIMQQLRKFDKKTGIVKTKAATNKKTTACL